MTEHKTTIPELTVTLHVTSYHRGSPGSFDPRTGGSPPEGPEVEFDVYLTAEGRPPLDITEYLTDDVLCELQNEVLDAIEDNERGGDEPPAGNE